MATTHRLKVMVVVPFAPRRDATHGGRVVAQMLMQLAERHTVALVYLTRPNSATIEPELAERLALVEQVRDDVPSPRTERWRHRWSVATSAVAGMPVDVLVSRDRRFKRAIRSVAQRFQPDIIQIETDRAAHYVRALAGTDAPCVLVCHEPGLTSAEHQRDGTRGRQRLAHRIEILSWRRYWDRTLGHYAAIVAFTERDEREIEAASGLSTVVRIPLGIDIPDEPLSATGGADPVVCFVGGYAHPPNVDGALRLIRDVMPGVREQVPDARLTLVGATPPPVMRAAAGPLDTVTGTVEQVAPYIDEATVVALPIRTGGGMRVKLLEALAAGKAVVASPLGAAGTGAEHGQQLLLAESDAEFVAAIVQLLQYPRTRETLAAGARAWAIAELSWASRIAAYERLYRELLGSGDPRTAGSPARSTATAPPQRSRA